MASGGVALPTIEVDEGLQLLGGAVAQQGRRVIDAELLDDQIGLEGLEGFDLGPQVVDLEEALAAASQRP